MATMQLSTKIFLDSGDPGETREADRLLSKAGLPGIEGQTTNPSLIVKYFGISVSHEGGDGHPKLHTADKVSSTDGLAAYCKVVTAMAKVTQGPISIQVIAEESSSVEELLTQARDRITWIPNGVIKFPCTENGLAAAEVFCQEGPVNITLVFSQEQAAAVYSATRAHNYDVYVSPFVGRIDDRGEKGMDVVANILEMYRKFGDGHVKVLTASIRTIEHLLYALWLKSDCVTVPMKILKEWVEKKCSVPPSDYFYDAPGLLEIPYQELSLENDWKTYDISHELTHTGVAKFWEDWKSVVE